MWLNLVKVQGGKRRIVWPALLVFVTLSYATVIGSAEVFWRLFTGGYSPLVALFALFTATLIVVRGVGESFALPTHVVETWLND